MMTGMLADEERHHVLNAFRPGLAIDTPAKFAGRKHVIEQLTDALHVDGSTPVIYGERGLGKTSVAHQIERIALGDVELLESLDLARLALAEGHRFVTFYLSCTDDIRNKDELLQRFINLGEGYDSPHRLPRWHAKTETSRRALKLKIYESEVRSTYESQDRLQDFVHLSME